MTSTSRPSQLDLSNVAADGTTTFTAVGLASFLGAVKSDHHRHFGRHRRLFGGSLGVWGVTDLLTLNAVSGTRHHRSDGALAAAAAIRSMCWTKTATLCSHDRHQRRRRHGGPDPDVIVDVEIDGGLLPTGRQPRRRRHRRAVLIVGRVLFSSASATDSLAINAATRSSQHRERRRDRDSQRGRGSPSGLLALTSGNIWAGSQSRSTSSTPTPFSPGRDALAGTNPGPRSPDRLCQAAGGVTAIDRRQPDGPEQRDRRSNAGIRSAAAVSTSSTKGTGPASHPVRAPG